MASPLAITVVLTVILSKVSSSATMHCTSQKNRCFHVLKTAVLIIL